MRTLHNEIMIEAPVEKIWEALSVIDNLEKFDPLVQKSTVISERRFGVDAKRKVDMKDGKNWFEEKVTDYQPNISLEFQLTDCSFPIHGLSHRYTFEKMNNQVKVKQVMQYTVKFGILGAIMDTLMIKKQTDSGIKKFLAGLKEYTEKQ